MTGRTAAALGGGALDVLAAAVFVAAGRRTHDGAGLPGLLATAAPFLAALALGWLLAGAWRAPAALRTGLVVWSVTVVGGLLLRAAATGRLPASFAVVTTVALGVLLIGWRAVAAGLVRAVRRPADCAARPTVGP